MTFQARIAMALLWIGSLIIVGSIATAQSAPATRSDPAPVVSGADFGFKPEGWQGRARTGKFVVRVNGEWVEAIAAVKPSPAATR